MPGYAPRHGTYVISLARQWPVKHRLMKIAEVSLLDRLIIATINSLEAECCHLIQ